MIEVPLTQVELAQVIAGVEEAIASCEQDGDGGLAAEYRRLEGRLRELLTAPMPAGVPAEAERALGELQALAENATPGPWRTFFCRGEGWGVEVPDAEVVANCDTVTAAKSDAAYIAACSPDRILGLLARLRAAEERADRLEAVLYLPALNRAQRRAEKHGPGVSAQLDDSVRQGG